MSNALQIHDELLFEVHKSRLQEFAVLIRQVMEEAWPLSVPLPIKLRAGPNWGQMKTLTV